MSNRKRLRPPEMSDPSGFEERRALRWVQEQTQSVEVPENSTGTLLYRLEQVALAQARLAENFADLVDVLRGRGVGWEVLGDAAGVSGDTLRRRAARSADSGHD